MVRDVTEAKQAKSQIQKHQAEHARVSRILAAEELVAGITHELSQRLTAIASYGRGCLRLLTREQRDVALLREGIQEIVQQAEWASQILSRLREPVRKGTTRRQKVPVRSVIDAAVGLAAIDIAQAGIEIAVRTDPDLPDVLADRIQIEQVLLNLLRNAGEALAEASVDTRSIVIEGRHHADGAVEISVADTGPGVDPDVRDRIFEPFVSTKPLGMGIGLSISRTIVEAHGGTLRLAEADKKGARLVFDLAAAAPAGSGDAS